jgi:Na+/proline symporter
MLVCAVLHTITAQHGIPFELLVAVTTAIAWGYTFRGGVKSVIWSDMLKSIILIGAVIAIGILLLYDTDTALLADNLRHTPIIDTNPYSPTFLPKSFVAGVVVVVAMTGLDQDMMQRTLSCRNRREAQLNVMISGVLQVVVIALFLLLGVVMYTFAESSGSILPESGDALFPSIATMPSAPKAVGVLFVLGLAASSFSSIGSAMTALTTSFTLDILRQPQGTSRHLTHAIVAIIVGALAIALYHWGNDSAIDLVFGLAAYTYGPILGLFAFGITTRRQVSEKYIPILALLTPAMTYAIDQLAPQMLNGYRCGHEILAISAIIMYVAMFIFSKKNLYLQNKHTKR